MIGAIITLSIISFILLVASAALFYILYSTCAENAQCHKLLDKHCEDNKATERLSRAISELAYTIKFQNTNE